MRPSGAGSGAVPGPLFELARPVAAELHQVEARLRELLPAEMGGPAPAVYQHVLGAGGKRLRPLLTLLSCAAAGGDPAAAVIVATSVEVVHLSSLIHDDVIDEARERRGQPTARERWGNRTSILVGDLLIAEVFRGLSAAFDQAALSVMAEAVVEMCRAELSHGAADEPADEGAYFANIRGKTAALMAAACEVGAIAAENPAAGEALREYGLKIGLAFQITDDLLDLYGDPAKLGKPIGQDLGGRHWTLPVMAALQAAPPEEHRRLEELLERSAAGEADAAPRAADLVAALGGREYAAGRARELVEEAGQLLTGLADTPARASLQSLAEYISQRES